MSSEQSTSNIPATLDSLCEVLAHKTKRGMHLAHRGLRVAINPRLGFRTYMVLSQLHQQEIGLTRRPILYSATLSAAATLPFYTLLSLSGLLLAIGEPDVALLAGGLAAASGIAYGNTPVLMSDEGDLSYHIAAEQDLSVEEYLQLAQLRENDERRI